MNEYSDFDEARIRHLELVQGVISRLGTNSFLVKGWAITVSGAFLGFAITEKKWGLALISLVPTALFWGLDACLGRGDGSQNCRRHWAPPMVRVSLLFDCVRGVAVVAQRGQPSTTKA
jgi:hypothetical protein